MTKEQIEQNAEEYSDAFMYKGVAKQSYINGALSRQPEIDELKAQIKELEQKLEQTEKDLADYQFNYPSIKELSKENAELKRINSETISQLNLDNRELIIKVEQLENDKKELLGIIQGKDKVIKQAKEIIKGLLSCARNYPEGNLEKMQRAENFLKE